MLTHLPTICIAIAFTLAACRQDHATIMSPEEDTRIWVKNAYDSVDIMKIGGTTFNKQRALLYKQKVDNETNPSLKLNYVVEYAVELLKAGDNRGAIELFNSLLEYIKQNNVQLDPETKRNFYSMIGITYMRYGEIENCVQNHNHQSCFIPIAGGGIHKLPFGSEGAIKIYESILEDFPNDLETRYLLNIAYMTLGKFPDGVPAKYRLDPAWFNSAVSMKPFKDIAPELGLNRNGHAGGVVMDDFTNDGWLDIVITSMNVYEPLIFYVNNGNGTFTDKTTAYKLDGQVGSLNLNQTDFNNDGWLDLYLMRGAWLLTEGDIPNTLLMNTGKGYFVDVTLKAGLTKHGPTQNSAWSDFNLDGYLDLVIGNESMANFDRGIDLYINQKNGTFRYESAAYGLTQNEFFKGSIAADVNNDKYPDIYLSSRSAGNYLYINQAAQGQKAFKLMENGKNLDKPKDSFPCWNFDFDNDGNEDIFVSAYSNEKTPGEHWMRSKMGNPDPEFLPKLYHNKGNLEFEEVGMSMGLNEVAFTMGCNFGDINTDGFLDFYLSTGNPQFQSIVPNKMYLNMEGKSFEDVSYSGGFANIQKGHGVAFGDLDHDGDEDLYVVIGGAFDGDMFYNCLFENPNEHNNNWLTLKLKGQKANAAAIGARVGVTIEENGQLRQIHRTITSGASFGGNSLALEIGLRKAESIKSVMVKWPCQNCPDQVFEGFELNKAYILDQAKSTPEPMNYQLARFNMASGSDAHHHHHSHQ